MRQKWGSESKMSNNTNSNVDNGNFCALRNFPQVLPSSLKWGQKRKLLTNLPLSWQLPKSSICRIKSDGSVCNTCMYRARIISGVCYQSLSAKSRLHCRAVLSVRVNDILAKWDSLKMFIPVVSTTHFFKFFPHGHFSLFSSWTTLVQLLFDCHSASPLPQQCIFLPVS